MSNIDLPSFQPECRCPSTHPLPFSGNRQLCGSRVVPTSTQLVSRVNTRGHAAGGANDGDLSTRWQSPAYTASFLTIDLLGLHEVFSANMTFSSVRPKSMYIERSKDNGKSWSVIQFYAQNCKTSFGLEPDTPKTSYSFVNCLTSAAQPSPGTVSYMLFDWDERPQNYGAEAVQASLATHLRFVFLETFSRTPLTPALPDGYFAVSDISVLGRVACFGHAGSYVLEASSLQRTCQCSHFTQGSNCDACLPMYNDDSFKSGDDLNSHECKLCDCNQHATSCTYSAILQGGVCQDCDANTSGASCETCAPNYFRADNVSASAANPCAPCNCGSAGTMRCVADVYDASGLAPGSCVCKSNVEGATCSQCKANFYNLTSFNAQGCQPCTCHVNGTIAGSPCNPFTGQCACIAHASGEVCSSCDAGFYGLQSMGSCTSCDCDTRFTTSNSSTCDATTGQCSCLGHSTGRTCSSCESNYFRINDNNTPCTTCNCSALGALGSSCDPLSGQCSCAATFSGRQCDTCISGYTRAADAICNRTAADVVFLFDASGTVTQQGFSHFIQGAQSLVTSLKISSTEAHVALVTFTATSNLSYSFAQEQSLSAISNAMNSLIYRTGSKATGAAIAFAIDSVFATGRSGVPKLLVLFTNGPSLDSITTSAARLRGNAIETFVIAMVDYLDVDAIASLQSQITTIASTPTSSHAFMTASWSAIDNASSFFTLSNTTACTSYICKCDFSFESFSSVLSLFRQRYSLFKIDVQHCSHSSGASDQIRDIFCR
jgi:hypothetical protein